MKMIFIFQNSKNIYCKPYLIGMALVMLKLLDSKRLSHILRFASPFASRDSDTAIFHHHLTGGQGQGVHEDSHCPTVISFAHTPGYEQTD